MNNITIQSRWKKQDEIAQEKYPIFVLKNMDTIPSNLKVMGVRLKHLAESGSESEEILQQS